MCCIILTLVPIFDNLLANILSVISLLYNIQLIMIDIIFFSSQLFNFFLNIPHLRDNPLSLFPVLLNEDEIFNIFHNEPKLIILDLGSINLCELVFGEQVPNIWIIYWYPEWIFLVRFILYYLAKFVHRVGLSLSLNNLLLSVMLVYNKNIWW